MAVTKIGVLIGSLRKDSFSRKMYLTLQSMVPAPFEMEEIKIGDLPMYNQDFDDDGKSPQSWSLFDDKNPIINEKTREFLQKFVDAFIDWIKLIAPHKP
ncbi:MAG: NAD(P)H-dependent oxidoreductase [Veillonellales bacterium]